MKFEFSFKGFWIQLNLNSIIWIHTYYFIYIYMNYSYILFISILLYYFYTYNLWDLKMWRLVVERHHYYPKQNCKKAYLLLPPSPQLTHSPSFQTLSTIHKTKQKFWTWWFFFHTRMIVLYNYHPFCGCIKWGLSEWESFLVI